MNQAPKIVGLEVLVENVAGEGHRLRDRDFDVVEIGTRTREDFVHEGKTASLAAESRANTVGAALASRRSNNSRTRCSQSRGNRSADST